MKIVNDYNEMVEYAVDFLEEDNSLFITEYKTALKVIDEIQEVNDKIYNIDVTNFDSEEDELVYIKNIGDDVIIIKNVFNNDGEIEDYIGTDFVLIEDGLLLKDIIDDNIYAEEEISYVRISDIMSPVDNAIKTIKYLLSIYGDKINPEDLEDIECQGCDSGDCECENCSVDDDCEEEELIDDEDIDETGCSEYDWNDMTCRECCQLDSEDEERIEDYEIDRKADEIYQLIKDNGFNVNVIKFILREIYKGLEEEE